MKIVAVYVDWLLHDPREISALTPVQRGRIRALPLIC